MKTISCEDLANLDLNGNVVYQPGTRLVKLLSAPTVYAVESNGVLRPIRNEAQAEALYGEDWADFVDDIPDSLFVSFELGLDLDEAELPEGMILVDTEGDLLRVDDDGVAIEIEDVLESEDDELLLEEVAESLERVESRIRSRIRISDLSQLDSEEILTLLEMMQDVDVDVDTELEIEIEIEEEDEEVGEEAAEEIAEADAMINRAEERINNRHRRGQGVSEDGEQLRNAFQLLKQAREAYRAGNYDEAERLAEGAQNRAENARMGSEVISLDDGIEV